MTDTPTLTAADQARQTADDRHRAADIVLYEWACSPLFATWVAS